MPSSKYSSSKSICLIGCPTWSPREQALLKALTARSGHAVKRERLLQLVFPDDANVQVEAIEAVIHRLRKKWW